MNNNSDSVDKFLGLEVLRFVAAMSVLLVHYGHFAWPEGNASDVRIDVPFYWLLWPIYEYGRYGVQVFWAISGYIFFWKYKDRVAQGSINGGEFFVLRFSRLYPLHFITLLAVAALQFAFFQVNGTFFLDQGNDAFNFALHLFMASDWGIRSAAGAGFNSPIWSISVEVLVYFIFYAVLRTLGASLIWSMLIVVVCVAAVLFKFQPMVIQCALFFYVGGIVATVQPRLSAYRRLVTVACILLLAALPAAEMVFGEKLANVKPSHVILVATPAVLLLMTWHFHAPHPLHGTIKAAGNMTYSSYLLHFPIQLGIALAYTRLEQTIPYQSPGFFICFMAVVLAASRYTYVKFEAPWQDLIRRRFVIRRGAAAT